MLVDPYNEATTAFDKALRRLAGKLLLNAGLKPTLRRNVLWHTYHYGKPYLLFTTLDILTRKNGRSKTSLLKKLPNRLIPACFRPDSKPKDDRPLTVRTIIALTAYPKLDWLRNFIFDMWHYRTLNFKLFKIKYGKARALDKKG